MASVDTALRELLREVVRDEVRAALQEFAEELKPRPDPAAAVRYLTADQAANVAGVSPASIRDWVRKGELRGGHIRANPQG